MNDNKLIQTKWFKPIVAVICIVITVVVLNHVARLMQQLISISYDWKFEFLMVMGMILFQYPFIRKEKWDRKMEYYFNMLLVSAMGAVLLIPLLILNHYFHCSIITNVSFFFLVVLIMFFEHKRRVTKLSLPWVVSYTWVLYRFLILMLIL